MTDALQTAAAGMNAATRRLDGAARSVADLGTETLGTETLGTGTGGTALPPAARIDLSGTALDLIGARTAFAMNAAVLRTADTMERRLLDIAV